MEIKLVRHGQAETNAGLVHARQVGELNIKLTDLGIQQSTYAGASIGPDYIRGALIYVSPYLRARQTLEHMLKGANIDPCTVTVFEDGRLREIDCGLEDIESQRVEQRIHSRYLYRFLAGGENEADVEDRMSSFLSSLYRQFDRSGNRQVLIVTHARTIRMFVKRFFHLTVAEYDRIVPPKNCDIVTISALSACSAADKALIASPNWCAQGLRFED